MKRWCASIALLQALLVAPAGAQSFDLTVANIMRGPEHVGEPPSNVRWSDDSRWVFFRWKPGGTAWHEPAALYRVRAAGGAPERLDDVVADSLGVLFASGDISADGRSRVVSHQGDLYLIDRRSLGVRRLTDTRAGASSPVFARDGRT
ncbi:MAG: TolB family protein, partial [Longimicrobiales bacterium]